MANIGIVRVAAKDYAGAATALKDAETRLRATLGADHPELATVNVSHGEALDGAGDQPAAERKYREALELARRTLPADHPDVARVQLRLGNHLVAAHRYDEAEPLLLSACGARERNAGAAAPATRACPSDVVKMYVAWGVPEKAESWRTRSTPPP